MSSTATSFPASSSTKGHNATPEELEQRLATQRIALAESVDALADRLSPRVQARQVASRAKESATHTLDCLKTSAEQAGHEVCTRSDDLRERGARMVAQGQQHLNAWRERAEHTVEQAREGDSHAIRTVGTVIGGTMAAAAIVGTLLARRSR